jgi:hypothetical protein
MRRTACCQVSEDVCRITKGTYTEAMSVPTSKAPKESPRTSAGRAGKTGASGVVIVRARRKGEGQRRCDVYAPFVHAKTAVSTSD